MIKRTILILFFLLPVLCFGQNGYLERVGNFDKPDSSFKGYYDSSFDEYYNFISLLHAGFSQNSVICYTVIPTFEIEYAFSIEKVNDKYYIISNKLSENFWYYAKQKERIDVITNKTEINFVLYLKIKELFELFVGKAKDLEGDMGLDGTTYYFATTNKDEEIIAGKIWSPTADPILGRLVAICNTLHSMGINNNNKLLAQLKMLTRINRLICLFNINHLNNTIWNINH